MFRNAATLLQGRKTFPPFPSIGCSNPNVSTQRWHKAEQMGASSGFCVPPREAGWGPAQCNDCKIKHQILKMTHLRRLFMLCTCRSKAHPNCCLCACWVHHRLLPCGNAVMSGRVWSNPQSLLLSNFVFLLQPISYTENIFSPMKPAFYFLPPAIIAKFQGRENDCI